MCARVSVRVRVRVRTRVCARARVYVPVRRGDLRILTLVQILSFPSKFTRPRPASPSLGDTQIRFVSLRFIQIDFK